MLVLVLMWLVVKLTRLVLVGSHTLMFSCYENTPARIFVYLGGGYASVDSLVKQRSETLLYEDKELVFMQPAR